MMSALATITNRTSRTPAPAQSWTAQENLLFRYLAYILQEAERPAHINARVWRVLRSKHIKFCGPKMWQICGGATWLDICLGNRVATVTFVRGEGDQFLTEISETKTREIKPVGVHCAYCRGTYPGKMRCGGCRTARYCSEACLTMHWVISHKKSCGREYLL